MASWHPDRREIKELEREVDAYLAAVQVVRDELLRDPAWMPEAVEPKRKPEPVRTSASHRWRAA